MTKLFNGHYKFIVIAEAFENVFTTSRLIKKSPATIFILNAE